MYGDVAGDLPGSAARHGGNVYRCATELQGTGQGSGHHAVPRGGGGSARGDGLTGEIRLRLVDHGAHICRQDGLHQLYLSPTGAFIQPIHSSDESKEP
eukprot:672562-Prorocentrum_minimum.AAC.2